MYSGRSGALLHDLTEPYAYAYGISIGPVDDWDGDGRDDFFVGSLGEVEILSGADASVLLTMSGGASEAFGRSAVQVGDLNGDGFADFGGAAHMADANGTESGEVLVFSGGKIGSSGELLYALVGDAGDRFGLGFSAAGDVNGDGREDLIVGSANADGNGPESGRAQLFSGPDGTLIRSWLGDLPYDHFGSAVDGAGDVDGDGVPDLVVGAPDADVNDLSSGLSKVLSGADGSLIQRYLGYWKEDRHGSAVCGAGDVDLDGYADVFVGIPGDDDEDSEAGCARVFGHGFHLSYDQFVGGLLTTFHIVEATPGGRVAWAYSTTGDGPTRSNYGTLELSNSIRSMPPLTADSNGHASFTALVPPIIGVTVWFQALDMSSETLSNGTPATIQ